MDMHASRYREVAVLAVVPSLLTLGVGETDFCQAKHVVAGKQFKLSDLNRKLQTSLEILWPVTSLRPNRIKILARQDFARLQPKTRERIARIARAHYSGVGSVDIDDPDSVATKLKSRAFHLPQSCRVNATLQGS
ncbi:MAG: hypothetical protein ABIH03_03630 [Pseudomonadota bacterium]